MTRFLSVLMLASLSLAASTTRAANPEAPITVAILMFDGVQIIDFAAPYEVFGQARFKVFTVSRNGSSVTTAMDLGIKVDHSFETAPPADVIVIPGGDVEATSKDAATLAWIRGRSEKAQQVLSVCTGSDILAATGLLNGQAATTFHKHFDHMQHRFSDVRVVRDQRWVQSGKLITSAGLASGMDAALQVVANIRGLDRARSVAMHLEYPWSPQQGFVRGLMADQFIRMPVKEPQFPDGTQINRITSVGDARYWESTWSVRSTLSPAEFIGVLKAEAAVDKALTTLPLPDSMQTAWQYTAQRGGHWRMSFRAYAAERDQAFRVVLKVARLD